jgi:GTP cyclohydrolase II
MFQFPRTVLLGISIMARDTRTSLLPTPSERVARARADLRMGVPVVIASGDGGFVVLAAETAGPTGLRAACAGAAAGRRDHGVARRHAQGARL